MSVKCPPCDGTGIIVDRSDPNNKLFIHCELCKTTGQIDEAVYARMFGSKKEQRKSNWDTSSLEALFNFLFTPAGILILILFVGVFGTMLGAIIGGPSPRSDNAPRTDGVYESAVEKLDKGIPLNEREAKRIDDLLDLSGKKEAEEIERRHGER